jgi:hypothetical protein
MPGVLNGFHVNIAKILTTFHDEVEGRAVCNGASIASFQMLRHQIAAYKETLREAMTEARNQITEKQRNINREFEPKVLEHMLEIYNTCTNESGPGQYQRMRRSMEQYVNEEKQMMFEDAVDHVRDLAKAMLNEIEVLLLGKVDAVFMTIQRDYRSVVLGQEKGKTYTTLPRDQRAMRKEVLQILDTADTVFKRAVGSEREPSSAPSEKSQTDRDGLVIANEVKEDTDNSAMVSSQQYPRQHAERSVDRLHIVADSSLVSATTTLATKTVLSQISPPREDLTMRHIPMSAPTGNDQVLPTTAGVPPNDSLDLPVDFDFILS